MCVSLRLDPTQKPASFHDYVLVTLSLPDFPLIFRGSSFVVLWGFLYGSWSDKHFISFFLPVQPALFLAISAVLQASAPPYPVLGPPKSLPPAQALLRAPSMPIQPPVSHHTETPNSAPQPSLAPLSWHSSALLLFFIVCLSPLLYSKFQEGKSLGHQVLIHSSNFRPCLVFVHPYLSEDFKPFFFIFNR